MKILVTGIDGFIGRSLAARLSADGHEITGLSNGQGGGLPYRFFRADIRRRDEVRAAFEAARPMLCVHLAAMAHADVGKEKEALVRAVNVDGARHVFDAAAEAGCGRLIYFSTAKVLAETTGPEGIDEGEEPRPVGIYASSKREVELDLLERCRGGALEAAIVRPVAVIGRGDAKGNYAKLARMVRRGVFPLLDGGAARRSVVFVERIAARVSRMVDRGIVPGRAYVFSDGTFTIREIVDAMRSATGFAYCPSLPTAKLRAAGPWIDGVLGRIRPGGLSVENGLKRLTSSFAIRAHLFEEEFGALPVLDLGAEIRGSCGRS